MLGVSTPLTAIVLGAVIVASGPVWMALRRAHGFPALPADEKQLIPTE